MKLYTPARVEALKVTGTSAHVMPKPFPGRYPTHIYYAKAKGGFSYLGKPTADIIGFVHALANLHVNLEGSETLRFVEFDRAHKVVYWDTKERALKVHKRLFGLYHPAVAPALALNSVLMSWFGVPQRIERLSGHAYYVPRDTITGAFKGQVEKLLLSPLARKKLPWLEGEARDYKNFYVEYK